MKTIKLLLITAMLSITSSSYAQTKQEAIDWLKEKLGNYIDSSKPYYYQNVKLIKLNECEITFEYKNRENETIRLEMPTADVTIDEYGRLTYKVEAVKTTYNSGSTYFERSSNNIKIGLREENIYERIEKALKHLATFCPKKSETF